MGVAVRGREEEVVVDAAVADLEKRVADSVDIMFRGIPCHDEVLQQSHQIWNKLQTTRDTQCKEELVSLVLTSRGSLV